MAKQKWYSITPDDVSASGTGFLVERSHELEHWETASLQASPASTNMSHRPRLVGWCGTTNNVGVYGRGIGVLVKWNSAGDRALIREATPEEAAKFLEAEGWTDLLGEVAQAIEDLA
jgi:hypothetical protein